MKLYLMRHGEAVPFAASDAQRPLTPYGEECAAAAAEWLPESPRLLASPYLRTQQTATAVCRQPSEAESVEWLTPDNDPRQVLEALSQLSGDQPLLLVTHQPLISRLLGLLLTGDSRDAPAMDPASLACVECEVIAAGCAELQWLRHAPDFAEVRQW